jgi:hypothetical protein
MSASRVMDEAATLSAADKLRLLGNLVDDLFGTETDPRPITLTRGDRRVGTLLPEGVWTLLPVNPLDKNELERRIESGGENVHPSMMAARIEMALKANAGQ